MNEKDNGGVIVKVGNKWRIKGKKVKYWDAEYDTKADAEAALRAYWANKKESWKRFKEANDRLENELDTKSLLKIGHKAIFGRTCDADQSLAIRQLLLFDGFAPWELADAETDLFEKIAKKELDFNELSRIRDFCVAFDDTCKKLNNILIGVNSLSDSGAEGLRAALRFFGLDDDILDLMTIFKD